MNYYRYLATISYQLHYYTIVMGPKRASNQTSTITTDLPSPSQKQDTAYSTQLWPKERPVYPAAPYSEVEWHTPSLDLVH